MPKTSWQHYFDRRSSEWNICGFLDVCDLEPFQRKIEDYIKRLEAIQTNETGIRRDRARELLDKYKLASISVLFFEIRAKVKWRDGGLRASLSFKAPGRATSSVTRRRRPLGLFCVQGSGPTRHWPCWGAGSLWGCFAFKAPGRPDGMELVSKWVY